MVTYVLLAVVLVLQAVTLWLLLALIDATTEPDPPASEPVEYGIQGVVGTYKAPGTTEHQLGFTTPATNRKRRHT